MELYIARQGSRKRRVEPPQPQPNVIIESLLQPSPAVPRVNTTIANLIRANQTVNQLAITNINSTASFQQRRIHSQQSNQNVIIQPLLQHPPSSHSAPITIPNQRFSLTGALQLLTPAKPIAISRSSSSTSSSSSSSISSSSRSNSNNSSSSSSSDNRRTRPRTNSRHRKHPAPFTATLSPIVEEPRVVSQQVVESDGNGEPIATAEAENDTVLSDDIDRYLNNLDREGTIVRSGGAADADADADADAEDDTEQLLQQMADVDSDPESSESSEIESSESESDSDSSQTGNQYQRSQNAAYRPRNRNRSINQPHRISAPIVNPTIPEVSLQQFEQKYDVRNKSSIEKLQLIDASEQPFVDLNQLGFDINANIDKMEISNDEDGSMILTVYGMNLSALIQCAIPESINIIPKPEEPLKATKYIIDASDGIRRKISSLANIIFHKGVASYGVTIGIVDDTVAANGRALHPVFSKIFTRALWATFIVVRKLKVSYEVFCTVGRYSFNVESFEYEQFDRVFNEAFDNEAEQNEDAVRLGFSSKRFRTFIATQHGTKRKIAVLVGKECDKTDVEGVAVATAKMRESAYLFCQKKLFPGIDWSKVKDLQISLGSVVSIDGAAIYAQYNWLYHFCYRANWRFQERTPLYELSVLNLPKFSEKTAKYFQAPWDPRVCNMQMKGSMMYHSHSFGDDPVVPFLDFVSTQVYNTNAYSHTCFSKLPTANSAFKRSVKLGQPLTEAQITEASANVEKLTATLDGEKIGGNNSALRIESIIRIDIKAYLNTARRVAWYEERDSNILEQDSTDPNPPHVPLEWAAGINAQIALIVGRRNRRLEFGDVKACEETDRIIYRALPDVSVLVSTTIEHFMQSNYSLFSARSLSQMAIVYPAPALSNIKYSGIMILETAQKYLLLHYKAAHTNYWPYTARTALDFIVNKIDRMATMDKSEDITNVIIDKKAEGQLGLPPALFELNMNHSNYLLVKPELVSMSVMFHREVTTLVGSKKRATLEEVRKPEEALAGIIIDVQSQISIYRSIAEAKDRDLTPLCKLAVESIFSDILKRVADSNRDKFGPVRGLVQLFEQKEDKRWDLARLVGTQDAMKKPATETSPPENPIRIRIVASTEAYFMEIIMGQANEVFNGRNCFKEAIVGLKYTSRDVLAQLKEFCVQEGLAVQAVRESMKKAISQAVKDRKMEVCVNISTDFRYVLFHWIRFADSIQQIFWSNINDVPLVQQGVDKALEFIHSKLMGNRIPCLRDFEFDWNNNEHRAIVYGCTVELERACGFNILSIPRGTVALGILLADALSLYIINVNRHNRSRLTESDWDRVNNARAELRKLPNKGAFKDLFPSEFKFTYGLKYYTGLFSITVDISSKTQKQILAAAVLNATRRASRGEIAVTQELMKTVEQLNDLAAVWKERDRVAEVQAERQQTDLAATQALAAQAEAIERKYDDGLEQPSLDELACLDGQEIGSITDSVEDVRRSWRAERAMLEEANNNLGIQLG